MSLENKAKVSFFCRTYVGFKIALCKSEIFYFLHVFSDIYYMKNSLFFSFSIFLTAGIYMFYLSAQHHLSGVDLVRVENQYLKREVQQSILQKELIEFHFLNFKQEVAEVLPTQIKKIKSQEKSYPLRTLASVTSKESREAVNDSLGVRFFVAGQNAFSLGEYSKSIKNLEIFIEDYSYSRHAVDAYSLLVESYYQTGDLKKSLSTTELMVDQFPSHELTGFALIRMGTILKENNRPDEASQIFMTVLQAFKKNIDLRTQAKKLLSQL